MVLADEEKHALDLYETDENVMAVSNEVHFHHMLCLAKQYTVEFLQLEKLLVGCYPLSVRDVEAKVLSVESVYLFHCILGVPYSVFPHILTTEHIFVLRNLVKLLRAPLWVR